MRLVWHEGKRSWTLLNFLEFARSKAELIGLDDSLVRRPVNVGFSGGEKKRNEIFQMAVLEPKLSVLDEIDSGLDIDALRVVAQGVNQLRSSANCTIVITHYQRLLRYIVPDRVHVLSAGQIVRSGDKQLAEILERDGYGNANGASGATPSEAHA